MSRPTGAIPHASVAVFWITSNNGYRVGDTAGVSVAPKGLDSRVGAADRALVRNARLGDRRAFDAIVNRYGPDMYRYASRLLGNDADAAEAVQEAFVSAWSGIAGFEGRSALRTWLFTLVHRRAVDLQRHASSGARR